MKITIHRGAEEIGGNCIELQSGESRILLDYGAPLPKIDPATNKNVYPTPGEIIIKIPGLYNDGTRPLDGVIISHNHGDHYGGLQPAPIDPAVPVWMTAAMEELISITGKMPRDTWTLKASVKHYRRGESFTAGVFKLTPYLMDHSAPEAFAFLVEAEGKRLLYTGDYRKHGNKPAFERFLDEDIGPIDLLITEGTQAGVISGPTQRQVMADVERLVKGRDGAVYVMCSGQDMDMITSLSKLAKSHGRFLAIDGYIALAAETLRDKVALPDGRKLDLPNLGEDHVKIVDAPATLKINGLPEYAGFAARMEKNRVDWGWVNANHKRLIVAVRTYSQFWLERYVRDFTGAVLVYSMWNGYRVEESYHDTLQFFKGRGLPEFPIHASGHAYFSAIMELVENKKPKLILPVHTERPENFVWAFGRDRVRTLKNGGFVEI
jgi:ribonuclease J